MRDKIAITLIILAAVAWGLWCGGQVFNELMLIPIWSASPPETMRSYWLAPRNGGFNFFIAFNPLFTALSIAALVAGWHRRGPVRVWLAIVAVIGICLTLALVLYLAPLVGSTFEHAVAGDMSSDEILARVRTWKLGNRIRLAVEIAGFVCSLIAIYKWPKSAAV